MKIDYHDYVIKDGEFIGKFEEMYKVCDNPWNQKDSVIQPHKMACLASINAICPHRVLEIGCGLGYVTSFYSYVYPMIHFTGMDISNTAIQKARELFPLIEYICGDVSKISNFSAFGGGMTQ